VQSPAEQSFVIASGSLPFFFEGDQDFAVGARNIGDIALSQAGPACGNADVVDDRLDLAGRQDFADLVVNGGKSKLALLDASTGRSAGVQTHVAGIDRGKEVFTDQVNQAKRGDRDGQERREDNRAMAQRPFEQADVAETKKLEHMVKHIVHAPKYAPCAGGFAMLAVLV